MFELSEKEKVAHLLRRFGLGASESEMDYYGDKGLNGAIEKLLNYEKIDSGFDIAATQIDVKQLKPKMVQSWWILKMLSTKRPLEEKLTLFWHNHFATSIMKVDVAVTMYNQNLTLRENAMGKFEDLLLAISKDPAMLYWLDNQFNVKEKPNENFAREVMELFTLGFGNYTEKDIQEAARAFTGWTYGVGRRFADKPGPLAKYRFLSAQHDDGIKTVLGNKGKFNGDDVCGILAGNPQTPKFIATKMWQWFCGPDPSDKTIEKHASEYRNNGLKTRALVESIMRDPEFYSERCYRKLVKNPIDFCVVSARQLGYGQRIADASVKIPTNAEIAKKAGIFALGGPILNASIAMGMEVMNPPDVSGWKTGDEWISSATMVERIKFSEALFQRMRLSNIGLFDDSSAAGVSKSLCSILDIQLPPSKMKKLEESVEAISNGRLTAANTGKVCAETGKLIFGSPEFQYC